MTPPRLLAPVELVFPEEALAGAHAGDVVVRVGIDAEGRVTVAEVLSGDPVFHAQALDAARRLQFAPARLGERAVASSEVVRFHFEPPVSSTGEALDEPVEEIVVVAPSPDAVDTHARTTLGEAELERSAGVDLAQTAAQVPGVTVAGATSDTSKPMIRGQVERRLLVLFDGVRHESQKWGSDHAPEIDPFAAGSIGVIRGAAGVRYGPDAIGGVLLVDPPAMRTEPGVGGRARLGFSSNGLRPYGALRLDLATAAVPGLSLRAEGTYARGAALSSPDYVLGNTGSEQWNLGAAVQYQRGASRFRVSWHHHDLRAGVFYGVRNETPADFEAQLDAERPVSADLWTTSYAIDRPYQAVTHDILSLHARTPVADWGTVAAVYAFQLNHRREYAQVRDAVTGPQYDFELRTHTLDLSFEHRPVRRGAALLEGGFGVQGAIQENVYDGLPLLPNYRDFTLGTFAFERVTVGRAAVEVGARYDHASRVAWLSRQDFERHQRRGTLDGLTCTVEDDGGGNCPTSFDTGSVSVGVVAHLVADHVLDLKIDLSSASRFPDVDEQYLIGAAPTFPVYALGDPSLRTETTWGGSPTLELRLPWLEAQASAHASYIERFVYFAPELTAVGEPAFDVTIRGTFPRYGYRPIDAVFYGADGGVRFGPTWFVGLDVDGALVRGQDAATGEHLVGVPADRLRLALTGRPPSHAALRDPYVTVAVDLVGRQTRVDPEVDFAPAPDGYALVHVEAGALFRLKHASLRVGLEVHNLLDRAYREYTSLLRYYADQPGRDVRLRLGVEF